MNLRANEIRTGLLVLVTASVLIAVVIVLSAPGFFYSLNTYYVCFDNAAGVESGTYVFLAGRRVGQVVGLRSPLPVKERPQDHPDYEVLIEVEVAKSARIYRDVHVRMQQYGWFGLQMIDFVEGDEHSGLAPSGTAFVGERVPTVGEVSEQATATFQDLHEVLANVKDLTGENGDLALTAANAREFTNTIRREPWRLIWKSHKKPPAQEGSSRKADGSTSSGR